ncbi:MAG: hypothetical protein ACPGNV_04980 [Mangrovicoccus sp.]
MAGPRFLEHIHILITILVLHKCMDNLITIKSISAKALAFSGVVALIWAIIVTHNAIENPIMRWAVIGSILMVTIWVAAAFALRNALNTYARVMNH